MCQEIISKQRKPTDFCQKPSDRYLELLAECEEDPRVAAGLQAIRDLESTGGWMPTLDARDSRVVKPER